MTAVDVGRPIGLIRPGAARPNRCKNARMTTPEGPRFLTLSQVSEELNISPSRTSALVRTGDLKGIQIGGRNQWRVERVMLEEYIAEAQRRTAQQLDQLPDDPPPTE